MLAHGVAPAKRQTRRSRDGGDVPPSWDDAAELARLVVAEEVPMALSFVDSLHDRGVTADAVLLDVCAPTARMLGQFWEQDLCSFAQVTIGLSRLQQLMRELSPALDQALDRVRDDQKMLLLPAPGEQHTFGLSVLGLMFRQAGFQVYGGDLIRPEEATSLVRFERFVAIGFSASCDEQDRIADGPDPLDPAQCRRSGPSHHGRRQCLRGPAGTGDSGRRGCHGR